MKIFNIIPTVVLKDEDITVTSPREISSLLWDVSTKSNSSGVFDRRRPNGVDTQLQFWANPGYSTEQVQSLVVAATYLATVWQGSSEQDRVDQFWQTGFETHISLIKTKINTNGFTPNIDICRYVFSNWLSSRALAVALDSYNRLVRVRLNDSFTGNRLSYAREAVKRLRFLNPQATFIGAERVNSYIEEIERYLPELEADHNFLLELQAKTDEVIMEVNDTKLVLESNFVDTNTFGTNLYQRWKDFLALVSAGKAKCQKYVDSFDAEACSKIMERISEITPSK